MELEQSHTPDTEASHRNSPVVNEEYEARRQFPEIGLRDFDPLGQALLSTSGILRSPAIPSRVRDMSVVEFAEWKMNHPKAATKYEGQYKSYQNRLRFTLRVLRSNPRARAAIRQLVEYYENLARLDR